MNTGLSESPMIFKSILRIYLIFVICLLCTLIFQIKVSERIGIRLNLITQRIHYYLNLLPLEREKKMGIIWHETYLLASHCIEHEHSISKCPEYLCPIFSSLVPLPLNVTQAYSSCLFFCE